METNLINEFMISASYVINTPYFWHSMSMVTIIAMLIGSLVYNGDLTALRKGLLGMISYGLLIILTSLTRVYSVTSFQFKTPLMASMALAGSTTIFIVTLFYVLGLLIGVFIHKYANLKAKETKNDYTPVTK